ncbi:hypothetical protein [Pedobacter sp. NJ-S-72]
MARLWYTFIGGNDPTNFLNYYKISVKHECLCGNQICAVYVAGNGNSHPDTNFSQNIQQYIKDALSTGQIQPEIPFNTKKYVYLKY